MLNEFAMFYYRKFDDTDTQNHFLAVMLLCATLRRDRQMKEEQIAYFQELLNGITEPLTDSQAFQMAVLFVATRKAGYRMAAKHYEQTHSTLSPSLKRLMPLIKEIKTR